MHFSEIFFAGKGLRVDFYYKNRDRSNKKGLILKINPLVIYFIASLSISILFLTPVSAFSFPSNSRETYPL